MRELVAGLFTVLIITFATVSADDAPGGWIVGRVIEADSREPIAFAQLIVIETRLGTQSDADGYFYIPVPERSFEVRVSAIGYEALKIRVDVRAGRRTWVEVRMILAGDGQIPGDVMTRAPDPTIVNRIRSASEVRLYRLAPEGRQRPDFQSRGSGDARYLGMWPVRRARRAPSRAWSDSLIRVLTNRKTYLNGLSWELACTPMPGVGIRLSRDSTVTDVEICLECGIVFMQSTGLHPTRGRLSSTSTPLKLLIQQAFPRDSAIQAMR